MLARARTCARAQPVRRRLLRRRARGVIGGCARKHRIGIYAQCLFAHCASKQSARAYNLFRQCQCSSTSNRNRPNATIWISHVDTRPALKP